MVAGGNAVGDQDSASTLDSPAHHKTITEHRALARVPTCDFHAFVEYQPGRRHDTRGTTCESHHGDDGRMCITTMVQPPWPISVSKSSARQCTRAKARYSVS